MPKIYNFIIDRTRTFGNFRDQGELKFVSMGKSWSDVLGGGGG